VDLLIVVLILGLLANLSIPLVARSREEARQQRCSQNLRQLGLALHAYHDAFRVLPPAAVWSGEMVREKENLRTSGTIAVTHQNWAQLLLPFVGEESLAAQFDPAAPITSESNRVARTTELPVMQCPLDPYNSTENQCEWVGGKYARGNYAINLGVRWFYDVPGDIVSPRAWGYTEVVDLPGRHFEAFGDGVAGINKSFRLDDFTNGQSTMVALDEVRAGIAPMDQRGVWAVGQIGASITFNHGLYGDAVGPNSTRPHADDIESCPELYKKYGHKFVMREGMTCCDHCGNTVQAGARSRHIDGGGGVHLLMLDGSVRYAVNETDPTIWHLLHSSITPEAVLVSDDIERRLAGERLNHRSTGTTQTKRVHSTGSELPEQLTNSIGITLRQIPAGNFLMGLADVGNEGAMEEEVPTHQVTISEPFLMGIHEVTQEQFQLIMNQNPSWFSTAGPYQDRLTTTDTSQLPVENVTWYEADEFCRKLTEQPDEVRAGRRYRLPTEAEWEYVCRSGNKQPRKHDRDPSQDAHLGEFGLKKPGSVSSDTTPVGSYPPNPFGIYDMRGNVWEWCQDIFARDYYQLSPETDPTGPPEGVLRVWRGTDWVFTAKTCKTSRLWALEPWVRSPCLGFRVVCILDGRSEDLQASR